MSFVARLFNAASSTGAIDVIVVKGSDGKMQSTPFFAHFGRRSRGKQDHIVDVYVNDENIRIEMWLTKKGNCYFADQVKDIKLLEEIDVEEDEYQEERYQESSNEGDFTRDNTSPQSLLSGGTPERGTPDQGSQEIESMESILSGRAEKAEPAEPPANSDSGDLAKITEKSQEQVSEPDDTAKEEGVSPADQAAESGQASQVSSSPLAVSVASMSYEQLYGLEEDNFSLGALEERARNIQFGGWDSMMRPPGVGPSPEGSGDDLAARNSFESEGSKGPGRRQSMPPPAAIAHAEASMAQERATRSGSLSVSIQPNQLPLQFSGLESPNHRDRVMGIVSYSRKGARSSFSATTDVVEDTPLKALEEETFQEDASGADFVTALPEPDHEEPRDHTEADVSDDGQEQEDEEATVVQRFVGEGSMPDSTADAITIDVAPPEAFQPDHASQGDKGNGLLSDEISAVTEFDTSSPSLGGISKCGQLINLKEGPVALSDEEKKVFEKHRISGQDFLADPSVAYGDDLVIMYGSLALLVKDALPVLLAEAVFGKSLDLARLEPEQDREEAAQARRRWYHWLLFRSSAEKAKREQRKEKADLVSPRNNQAALSPPRSPQHSFSEPATPASLRASSRNSKSAQSVITSFSLSAEAILDDACTPTHEKLVDFKLKAGRNSLKFVLRRSPRQCTEAKLFLWEDGAPNIVVADVDGTITKSDALGHLLPLMKLTNWTHTGIARFFSHIEKNGYTFMYLTSRGISMASSTRQYLAKLQKETGLPDGPAIMCRDSLRHIIAREVFEKRPQKFKIPALKIIQKLFSRSPFYAGFGNRPGDKISYMEAGISEGRIFTLNAKSEISVRHEMYKSFDDIFGLVDQIFPPVRNKSGVLHDSYNSWNFWKVPLPVVALPSKPVGKDKDKDKEKEKERKDKDKEKKDKDSDKERAKEEGRRPKTPTDTEEVVNMLHGSRLRQSSVSPKPPKSDSGRQSESPR